MLRRRSDDHRGAPAAPTAREPPVRRVVAHDALVECGTVIASP